jgi:transposase
VVRRWNHYSRGSLRRGRAKKNNPANEPADHALGRSQGGFSTKIHVKADGEGHVIGFTLTPGQTHEATQFQPLMEAGPLMGSQGLASKKGAAKGKGQANWPDAIGGDKAYSSNGIRDWCDDHGILPVIPTRSNEQPREDFDKDLYRERNIIERTIGWLKECRRVLTRFEKYAVHYAGMITLAIIQRLLPTG